MKTIKGYNIRLLLLFIIGYYTMLFGEKYIGINGPVSQSMSGSLEDIGAENIVHWSSLNISWKLNSNGAGDGLSFNSTKTAVQNAFNSWENVSTADIDFSYAGSTSSTWSNDGSNVSFWAESGDPIFNFIPSNVLAVTVISANASEEFTDVDIVFNGKDQDNIIWKTDGNDYDIEAVAAHEIGHMIGLHHTEVVSSPRPTMYAYYQGTSARSLEFDDRVGDSFLYRGNLIDNETLSGTNYLNWDWTVASGKTLTIQSSSQLTSENGVSLIVNGVLNATGTSSQPITFTAQSGTSPSSWGTIKLNGSGASSSVIKYADIKYATQVDVYNVPSFEISNCDFTDNYKAVYVYNSTGTISNNDITSSSIGHVIQIESGSNVDCKYNSITKSNNNGFAILYGGGSNGEAVGNDIYGCDVGIGAIWSSSPSGEAFSFIPRNNRIRNCNDGFKVYRLSYPTFGLPVSGSYSDMNSVYNNTQNAEVGISYSTYASGLNAYDNWWGSDPPNTSKFSIGSNAYFTYNPYLSTDPWYGIPKAGIKNIAATSSAESNESIAAVDPSSIFYGIELRFQKKYKEAKDFFISYITEYPDDQRAYVELYNCYSKETEGDLIKFFNSLPEQASEDHKLLLSYLYLRESRNAASETERKENVALAEKTNNSIIEENLNTSLSVRAKINNIYIALFSENNLAKASSIFTEIADKTQLSTEMELSDVMDAIEIYAGTYKRSGNDSDSPIIKKDITSLEPPKEYSLLGNYPNPFNPSTTISYNLPFISEVEVTIYDVLGNEVKSFIIPTQNAGTQKIIWNVGTIMASKFQAEYIYITSKQFL